MIELKIIQLRSNLIEVNITKYNLLIGDSPMRDKCYKCGIFMSKYSCGD